MAKKAVRKSLKNSGGRSKLRKKRKKEIDTTAEPMYLYIFFYSMVEVSYIPTFPSPAIVPDRYLFALCRLLVRAENQG
jgi:hypothetical protein